MLYLKYFSNIELEVFNDFLKIFEFLERSLKKIEDFWKKIKEFWKCFYLLVIMFSLLDK